MTVIVVAEQEKTIRRFIKTSLRAIVRAELDGRFPKRFSGTGQEVWLTFHNEPTADDLIVLAIQDASVTTPIHYNPSLWRPHKARILRSTRPMKPIKHR